MLEAVVGIFLPTFDEPRERPLGVVVGGIFKKLGQGRDIILPVLAEKWHN